MPPSGQVREPAAAVLSRPANDDDAVWSRDSANIDSARCAKSNLRFSHCLPDNEIINRNKSRLKTRLSRHKQ